VDAGRTYKTSVQGGRTEVRECEWNEDSYVIEGVGDTRSEIIVESCDREKRVAGTGSDW